MRVNTSQREQYGATVHLFIGMGCNPCKITSMPLIFTIDLRTIYRGLDNLFLFKSVSFSTAKPKLLHVELWSWFILLSDHAFHIVHSFIPRPKVPVNVLYLENMLVVFLRTFKRRRPPTIVFSSFGHYLHSSASLRAEAFPSGNSFGIYSYFL